MLTWQGKGGRAILGRPLSESRGGVCQIQFRAQVGRLPLLTLPLSCSSCHRPLSS